MKQADILSLSQVDLENKLIQCKQDYRKLKMAHSVNSIENPSQIKILRRTVARIATELSRREREEIRSK